jgi:hypothetical protein
MAKQDYTVELYKLDRRCKEGKKLVAKMDYHCEDLAVIENDFPVKRGYIRMIHETYVTRKNVMTGAEFKERYDTPYFCSPSSESYWSM